MKALKTIIANLVNDIMTLFHDDKITCPCYGSRLIPLPVYDGDMINGEIKHLNRDYIHFSCWCGYIFARQLYADFTARVDACPDILRCHALNYPDKDWQGAILPHA